MTDLTKISDDCIDDDGLGNVKITIDKNSIYSDYKLFEFKTSTGDPLASLAWMGTSLSTGDIIFQPAIATNIPGLDILLSYDGYANYIDGSELITMPSDGKTYTISPPKPYYFNNGDPLVFDPTYSLNKNNNSIGMHNISLFKSDHSQGVMIGMRASTEGSVTGPSDDGLVVIFLNIKTIK